MAVAAKTAAQMRLAAPPATVSRYLIARFLDPCFIDLAAGLAAGPDQQTLDYTIMTP
jgi:hypothetical protein